MKTTATLLLLLLLITINNTFAQTVYTISSNSSYPANCSNCSFNIASGATLTISKDGTCNNCSFTGGTIAVENNIKCQPCTFSNTSIVMTDKSINPSSKLTSFSNVTLVANGTSSITANTPLTISNSVFTFNGSSFFNNNGGQLDIAGSTLNFYDDAYFNANAGPVNLNNNSKLVAGSGAIASKAYIKMNGAALNLVDKSSSIVIANSNNYYFNWNSYSSLSNSKTFTTTYPSAASTLNCGAINQNACGLWSAPTVYGPSAFTANGVAAIASTLPVTISNFSVTQVESAVFLLWSTSQEVNTAQFIIERSTDRSNWTSIGAVASIGNSNVTQQYKFKDAQSANAVASYRLVIVDADGRKQYSAVKTVQASSSALAGISPNPASSNIRVMLPKANTSCTVQLFNAGGVLLQQQSVPSNTTMVSMKMEAYANGMYLVKIGNSNGTLWSGSVMVLR